MARAPEVVNLEESGLQDLAIVLARALEHDPLSEWLLPDARSRLRTMGRIMAVACRYAHKYGQVWSTAGAVEGGSLWLPPGNEVLTVTRLARCGLFARLPVRGGPHWGRLLAAALQLNGRRAHLTRPYWYLLVLGIDPARQGQGLGAALLRPGLDKADSAGLPCYLNTAKEANVRFYEHHSFRVLIETRVGGASGPIIWTMKRDPKDQRALSFAPNLLRRARPALSLETSEPAELQSREDDKHAGGGSGHTTRYCS